MPRSTFSHLNYRTGMVGPYDILKMGRTVEILEEAVLDNSFDGDINMNGNDILNLGSTTASGTIKISNTIQSTTTNSGALIVSGAVAIGKNLNIGGTTNLNNLSVSGNSTFSSVILTDTTSTGPLHITNTTNTNNNCTTGALIVKGGIGVCKDVYIKGSLTVEGNSTIINSTTTSVLDPLLKLASGNTSDAVDIGFYGQYNDGTEKFGGLYRDATDKTWKLFKDLTIEPIALITGATVPDDLSIGSLLLSPATGGSSLTISVPSGGVVDYTMVLPDSQGTTGSTLVNDGYGNLTWGLPTTFDQSLNTTDDVVFNTVEVTSNIVGDLLITSTTQTVDNTTGALVVDGGVAIGKDLSLVGNMISPLKITDVTDSSNGSTGALIVDGGVAVAKNMNIEGTLYVNDETESPDSSTGALVVAGGVAVGKRLNVDGNININDSSGVYKIGGNPVLESENDNVFVGIQSTSTTSGTSNTFVGVQCGTSMDSNNNTMIGKGVDGDSTITGSIAIGIDSSGNSAYANESNGLFFHKSLANVNSGNFVHYDATTGQMGPTNGTLNISSDINSKGDQLNLEGTYDPTSTMYGMDIQGDYLYVSDITVPSLRVLNIRDKTAPALISSTPLSASCKNVNVQGRYVYMPVLASGVINVIDVINPSSPTVIETFAVPSSSGTCSASYISCNCLFVGYGGKLHIIDIKDPENLSQITTLTLAGDNKGITGKGNIVYVVTDNSSATNLYSIDVSVPSSPSILETNTDISDIPNDLEIQGNLLYLVTDTTDKLHIIDISDPTSMSVLSSTAIASPVSMYLQGDFIYIMTSGSSTVGLSVYDISNPLSVTLVDNTNPGSALGDHSDVIGSGRYIYITRVNQQDLEIYNIEGSRFQAMHVGGLEVNQLHVKENITLDNNLYASGGLTLGNGFVSHNDGAVNGNLSLTGILNLSPSSGGGTISVSAPGNTTDYPIVLPASQGGSGEVLTNNGSGVLTWNPLPSATSTALLEITGTTQSFSVTTGALIVAGGAGIAKNVNIGGNLGINGKTKMKVRTVTTNDSLDDDYILNVDATGTATITLPNVSDSEYIGVTYMVINQSTNSTIIDTTGSDKIVDSGADLDDITLTEGIGERIQLVGNGDRWYVI